jgi:hypothetical protein
VVADCLVAPRYLASASAFSQATTAFVGTLYIRTFSYSNCASSLSFVWKGYAPAVFDRRRNQCQVIRWSFDDRHTILQGLHQSSSTIIRYALLPSPIFHPVIVSRPNTTAFCLAFPTPKSHCTPTRHPAYARRTQQ